MTGVPFLDAYVAGYTLYTGMGFGVDTTTAVSTWVLTDVTADVLQGDGTQGIVITRGRLDEFSQTSPAMAVWTLKNGADGGNGRYTPRRPQSDLWPYVKVGVPCQVAIITAGHTYEQFSGFVGSMEPDFDETGNLSLVVVTAYGSLQPLNGNKPLRSAMTYTIGTATPAPLAWWPGEDGANSTQVASGLLGGKPMTVIGPVNFAAGNAPGTGPLMDLSSGGQLDALLPKITSSSYRIEFVCKFPTFSPGDFNAVMQWYTPNGGIDFWEIDATNLAGGGLYVQWASGSTFGGPFVSNVAVDDNTWHHIRIDMSNSGGNHKIIVSLDGVAVITTTTAQAWSVANELFVNPSGQANEEIPTFGQLMVWAPWSGSINTVTSFRGNAGEDAVTRATRLCAENGVIFAADGTSNKLMGAQTVASLLTLLRECEAADGGVLEDGVGFGCLMHTAGFRANQAVSMALALTDLVPEFKPAETTQRVVNDAVVSRQNGSSAEFIQPAGKPYAPTGVGGVGFFQVPYTLNLQDDSQLFSRAAWYVHLGTVDEDRYSSMTINFARKTGKIPSWLACVLGSRVTVAGNYSTGGVNGADVLLEGWTLTLSRLLMKLVANCSPSVAWRIAVIADANTGRITGPGTTIGTTLTPTQTGAGIPIISTFGWTTTALYPADFPFDINLGGERVTISAIANELGLADGTFESGVTGWTPSGATFVQSATHVHSGSQAALLTVVGSPGQAFARANQIFVAPGVTYKMSLWAFSVAGTTNFAPSIDWFTSLGAFISTSTPGGASVSAGAYQNFTFTAVAPAGAFTAGYGPSLTGSPVTGTAVWVDDVSITSTTQQTATISVRSVNGVVKTQTTGTSVDVWRPGVVGL